MPANEIATYYAPDRQQWRAWLKRNHQSKQAVWLVCYKKIAGMPTVTWSYSVDEALCFGWIDSKRIPLDENRFLQFFAKRKSKGTWSKVNKAKIDRLINEKRMTKAGYETIEKAKQNGSWTILDDVEELKIPRDLQTAFKKWRGAKLFFTGLSKSTRKAILQWLILAKKPATRQKRITEIAELASQKQTPRFFKRWQMPYSTTTIVDLAT